MSEIGFSSTYRWWNFLECRGGARLDNMVSRVGVIWLSKRAVCLFIRQKFNVIDCDFVCFICIEA